MRLFCVFFFALFLYNGKGVFICRGINHSIRNPESSDNQMDRE
jgi:hypothetical protein